MLKTDNRKYDIFRLYYFHGATLVGEYRLPQLKQSRLVPENVISFNERNEIKDPENHWVDFFVDDTLFECFWTSPSNYLRKLHQFSGIITPDFSVFPEMLPGQRVWNMTRNRVMAYYLEQNGFPIIPTASWLGDDFDWCFDGLPEESSIAVSSNGCLSSTYGKQVFLTGIHELQQRKHPYKVIVCGRHMDELDVYDNIYYYHCFSQRWKERVHNG